MYGKSVKSVDNCKSRFTATLNRLKVFETAITRTLQQSSRAASDGDSATDSRVSDALPWQREEEGRASSDVAVMLNCSLLADDSVLHGDRMTATHLRQMIVSQHLRALLVDCRFVVHQSSASLSVCLSVCLSVSLSVCLSVCL